MFIGVKNPLIILHLLAFSFSLVQAILHCYTADAFLHSNSGAAAST